MSIDEAIDRLRELRGELYREGRLEKWDAVSLGIEALKQYASMKRMGEIFEGNLLPGETKE